MSVGLTRMGEHGGCLWGQLSVWVFPGCVFWFVGVCLYLYGAIEGCGC